MASSILFTFGTILGLICGGSKWGNMVVAIEDEDPPMALLPFGSAFRAGTFTRCALPPRPHPHPGDETATITVKNNCSSTIWPATFAISPWQPQPSTTGFVLAPGASRSLNVATPWTGRVWARTQCSDNGERFTCLTGDCSQGLQCNGTSGVPPATLAEFSLADSNGIIDFYDISLVDGFNIPASITTQGGTGPCKSANCLADVNLACPLELQAKSGNEVIGCKSACIVFNQPRYCCTENFASPSECKPTNYSQIFENQCPDAYSYPYDDTSSNFTCNNRPNYVVTFCG